LSKITTVIPPQAFEVIRDRIGEILTDELNNQSILSYNPALDIIVTAERSNPYASTELPAINISLDNGQYGNKNQGSVDGSYVFNIDAYTNAKTSDAQGGDQKASIELQELLGKCRAILENSIYITLGFQNPFILRTICSAINIASSGANDAKNTMMGRISFTVTANEKTPFKVPALIDGYETQIKLSLTEKGYLYQGGI
jgi:hypothetical protein